VLSDIEQNARKNWRESPHLVRLLRA
jgi:hypothetical protein